MANYPIVFALITLFLSNTTVYATEDSIDQKVLLESQEIRRLVNEKQDTQLVIEKIKNNEYRVLEVLRAINSSIQKSNANISRLRELIANINHTIIKTKNDISTLKQKIEIDELNIDRQLYALFYIRKTKDLTPFLGFSGLKNYFRNQWIIEKNTKLNIKSLKRYEHDLSRLSKENHRLEQQLSDRNKLLASEKEQHELLGFEKTQQRTYLQHIRKDRTLRMKYLQEIQIEVEKLNDIIYSLELRKEEEKKTKSFLGFRNVNRSLVPPVQGKIISQFEKSKKNRHKLFKRGILIETNENEEVQSVLEGKIVFAGPFRGYNKLIILDHGRGSFSVYGNLNELYVQVGEIVDANVALGVVGLDSETDKYLFYFETRRNKRPVNPLQWFKKDAWK